MTFLVHNKGFILAWSFWFGAAVCLMVGASALAVFGKRPTPPAPMVAIDGTKLPEGELPRTALELVGDNGTKTANLTATQWQEVRDLLKVLPNAANNITYLNSTANFRRQLLLAHSDLVFARYNQLPQQTKDDWQTLKDLKPASDVAKPEEFTQIQERFISTTLSVAEVGMVLENCAGYEALRTHIARSSELVDRIYPVLVANGLPLDASNPVEYREPKANLREFISHAPSLAAQNLTVPPPPLPAAKFTTNDLILQLSRAPLSEGPNSAARASSGNVAVVPTPQPNPVADAPLPLPDELRRLDAKFVPYAEQLMSYEKLFASQQEKERPNLMATATQMIPALKQDLIKHPLCWRDVDLLERSLRLLSFDPKEQLVPQYRSLCFAMLKEFYTQMDAVSGIERQAGGLRAQGRTTEATKLDEQSESVRAVAKRLLEIGKRFAPLADKPDKRYIPDAVGLFEKEIFQAEGALSIDAASSDFAKEWQRIAIFLKP